MLLGQSLSKTRAVALLCLEMIPLKEKEKKPRLNFSLLNAPPSHATQVCVSDTVSHRQLSLGTRQKAVNRMNRMFFHFFSLEY